MSETPIFRIANDRDLPALAELRWRLKDEHGALSGARREEFYAQFCNACIDHKPGEFTHWVAEMSGSIVAVISIQKVHKAPKPDAIHRCWGYVTNVYAAPEVRGSGVTARLLDAAKDWAKKTDLEFLIVWPGERARSFYEKAGFAAPNDVMLLDLER